MVSTNAITKTLKEARSKSTKRKFTQTIDLLVNLKGVDMKKPENRLNEELVLPRGRGKDVKIALIAGGELAHQGKKVVDKVITKEGLQELGKTKKAVKGLSDDYDFFIAQSDLMIQVGKYLGPVLGPRGKMPKPVPPNASLGPLVEKLRKTVRMKTKEAPVIQVPVGTEDLKDKELVENIEAALGHIEKKLERGLDNIKSVYLKTTMGTAVRLEV